mmetsp:Transcript_17537/g.49831  ORF Transcript_17537/g.49831 Transcript_17537/m.49831 type:complete len:109 (+) Transcript_17537:398-724(+)
MYRGPGGVVCRKRSAALIALGTLDATPFRPSILLRSDLVPYFEDACHTWIGAPNDANAVDDHLIHASPWLIALHDCNAGAAATAATICERFCERVPFGELCPVGTSVR